MTTPPDFTMVNPAAQSSGKQDMPAITGMDSVTAEIVIDGYVFDYAWDGPAYIRGLMLDAVHSHWCQNPAWVAALSKALDLIEPMRSLRSAVCSIDYSRGLKYELDEDLEYIVGAIEKMAPLREYFDLSALDESSSNIQEILRKRASAKEAKQRKLARSRDGRAGFVYVLKSESGTYKIGRTKNPDDRLRTFSVKLPFAVEYEALIYSSDMIALERDLHLRFADKRVNGEWFTLNEQDMDEIRLIGWPS